jgi:Zn-dependent peptidase ImmA (M78 family)
MQIKVVFRKVLKEGSKEIYGLWEDDTKTITLSLKKNRKISDFIDTLIHELLHAIGFDDEVETDKLASQLSQKPEVQIFALSLLFKASLSKLKKKNFYISSKLLNRFKNLVQKFSQPPLT